MEAVKTLDHSREELPGVEGSERSEGDDGNCGGPRWPGDCEVSLDTFWRSQLPGLVVCSSRSQLITMPYYLKDAEVAAEVFLRLAFAFGGLPPQRHRTSGPSS